MTESDPDRNRDSSVPPPASTEWSQEPAEEGGERPLPPFFAGAEEVTPQQAPEPPAPARPAEPAELEGPDTGAGVESPPATDEPFPFEDMSATVGERPADAGIPMLDAQEPEPRDDFPVEAFQLPGMERGGEPMAAPAVPDHTSTRALELAERLDRMAGALRSRGTAALTEQLAGGDRFDALLTGLLAGFLAAKEE